TQRNLELFYCSRSGTTSGSLLSIIDLTKTAIGGRLLKRWLGQPLLDITELVKRQDAISWFYDNSMARNQTISLLGEVADLERLINRVRSNIASPRELTTLRRSLEVIPRLSRLLADDSPINWLKDKLKPCRDVVELISEAIEAQPPASLDEGNVIKSGLSEELDSLRLASKNAKQYLANLERQERERSGIKSLKVGFNKVFGYYIEVSKSNLPQVPQD
ncbi:unnamed protein product, partial [marine sediment metagenome]